MNATDFLDQKIDICKDEEKDVIMISASSGQQLPKPLTCSQCRLSKVRCDKMFPCGRCKRRGVDCVAQVRIRRKQKRLYAKHNERHKAAWGASLLPNTTPSALLQTNNTTGPYPNMAQGRPLMSTDQSSLYQQFQQQSQKGQQNVQQHTAPTQTMTTSPNGLVFQQTQHAHHGMTPPHPTMVPGVHQLYQQRQAAFARWYQDGHQQQKSNTPTHQYIQQQHVQQQQQQQQQQMFAAAQYQHQQQQSNNDVTFLQQQQLHFQQKQQQQYLEHQKLQQRLAQQLQQRQLQRQQQRQIQEQLQKEQREQENAAKKRKLETDEWSSWSETTKQMVNHSDPDFSRRTRNFLRSIVSRLDAIEGAVAQQEGDGMLQQNGDDYGSRGSAASDSSVPEEGSGREETSDGSSVENDAEDSKKDPLARSEGEGVTDLLPAPQMTKNHEAAMSAADALVTLVASMPASVTVNLDVPTNIPQAAAQRSAISSTSTNGDPVEYGVQGQQSSGDKIAHL